MKPLNKAQLELYILMKEKYEKGEQFKKEDLLGIYDRYVNKNKRLRNQGYPNNNDLTEELLYSNASGWLSRAIATLVRRGYLGLTFNEEINCSKEIDRKLEICCG